MAADPRVTLSLSEAQSDICKEADEDPQSPLCAKVMLTGEIVKIQDKKVFEASVKLRRAETYLVSSP